MCVRLMLNQSGSLPSHPKSTVPTGEFFSGLESAAEKLRIHSFLVTDNLFAQGTIPQNLIAISFQPSSTGHEANGAITFGGADNTKYTGAINYAYVFSVVQSNVEAHA